MNKLLLLPLALIALFYGTTILKGHSALEEAKRAYQEEAKRAYQEEGFIAAAPLFVRAARWRSPFNGYASHAIDQLSRCAYEESCPNRILAIQSLREGITGSRSLLTYREDKRTLHALNALEEELVGSASIHPAISPKWNPWYQLLAQFALWGWLISMFVLIWRGCSSEGKLILPNAQRYIASATGFFLLWCVFLRLA